MMNNLLATADFPKLTFLNHASFLLETADSILIIDPWLQGTAFNNGWALLDQSTSNDNLYELLKLSVRKSLFIWYSHEHSDHFAVPLIKNLRKQGLNPTFLYQETLDHRVQSFLEKSGFKVIECHNAKQNVLDDNLSISVYPYLAGDSFCVIKLGAWTILNLNDCVVQTEADARRVRERLLPLHDHVDILFTQFGYASWIGNRNESDLREKAAIEKFDRISRQAAVLQPKHIIPFASFVYFCQRENFYMNDRQNSPKTVRESQILARWQNLIAFLKPLDSIFFNNAVDIDGQLSSGTAAAEAHWQNLFNKIAPDALESPKRVDGDVLLASLKKYQRTMTLKFICVPQLLELMSLIRPLRVLLADQDKLVCLSYRRAATFAINNGEWDISMSSATLLFIAQNEYGCNTTIVNGRFASRNGDESVRKFARFFSPQEYAKNGYGLRHPIHLTRIAIRFLGRELAGWIRASSTVRRDT